MIAEARREMNNLSPPSRSVLGIAIYHVVAISMCAVALSARGQGACRPRLQRRLHLDMVIKHTKACDKLDQAQQVSAIRKTKHAATAFWLAANCEDLSYRQAACMHVQSRSAPCSNAVSLRVAQRRHRWCLSDFRVSISQRSSINMMEVSTV
jgi:hypothetical protein